MKSLGLTGDELRQKLVEKEATHHEQTQKKKVKVPISVNPKIQFTRREKLQGTKGRCTEYHHTSQGEQVML
jgi:hypothetical protein